MAAAGLKDHSFSKIAWAENGRAPSNGTSPTVILEASEPDENGWQSGKIALAENGRAASNEGFPSVILKASNLAENGWQSDRLAALDQIPGFPSADLAENG